MCVTCHVDCRQRPPGRYSHVLHAYLQWLKGKGVDVDKAPAQQLIRPPEVPVPHLHKHLALASSNLGPLKVELLAPIGVKGPVTAAAIEVWCIAVTQSGGMLRHSCWAGTQHVPAACLGYLALLHAAVACCTRLCSTGRLLPLHMKCTAAVPLPYCCCIRLGLVMR